MLVTMKEKYQVAKRSLCELQLLKTVPVDPLNTALMLDNTLVFFFLSFFFKQAPLLIVAGLF